MNTRHTIIDSPLGELTLVADDDALIGVYFRHHWYRPSTDTFGPRVDAKDDALLAESQAQLDDYLAGDRTHFDVPTALRGDEFHRRIWAGWRPSPTAKPSPTASSPMSWPTGQRRRK